MLLPYFQNNLAAIQWFRNLQIQFPLTVWRTNGMTANQPPIKGKLILNNNLNSPAKNLWNIPENELRCCIVYFEPDDLTQRPCNIIQATQNFCTSEDEAWKQYHIGLKDQICRLYTRICKLNGQLPSEDQLNLPDFRSFIHD